jgi:hypothetical protein
MYTPEPSESPATTQVRPEPDRFRNRRHRQSEDRSSSRAAVSDLAMPALASEKKKTNYLFSRQPNCYGEGDKQKTNMRFPELLKGKKTVYEQDKVKLKIPDL